MRQLETWNPRSGCRGVAAVADAVCIPSSRGELVELDGAFWLVRDWQDGIAYDLLLRQRRFSADEVLLLLRQVLPVLAVVAGRGWCTVIECPPSAGRVGLPVLLEGGVQRLDGCPLARSP